MRVQKVCWVTVRVDTVLGQLCEFDQCASWSTLVKVDCAG